MGAVDDEEDENDDEEEEPEEGAGEGEGAEAYLAVCSLTNLLNLSGSRFIMAAASGFSGSAGLAYARSCGRKTVKMCDRSKRGLQLWLITSRQTLPERSSMLGWKMRVLNPIEGLFRG